MVTLSEASECPDGYVPGLMSASGEEDDKCMPCGVGTFANQTAGSCEQCSPGMYQDTITSTSCKNCESA